MRWAKIQSSTPNIPQAVSREDVINRADTYVINQWSDGIYQSIEAYQKGVLIHTTTAQYELQSPTQNGGNTDLNYLKLVKGFLFPELINAYVVQQNQQLTAFQINQAALQNTNSINSKITSSTSSITLIQTAQDGSNLASLNPILASNPIAGNILIAVVGMRKGATNRKVTNITQTNVVWAKLDNKYDGSNLSIEIWLGNVNSGALTSATVTLDGTTDSGIADLLEFVITGAALDVKAENSGNNNTSDTGTTLNTAQAKELWLGATVSQQAQTTPINGFTLFDGSLQAGLLSVAVLYYVASAIGTANAGCTVGAGGAPWCGCIVTLKG
jgi:hypothetical protein